MDLFRLNSPQRSPRGTYDTCRSAPFRAVYCIFLGSTPASCHTAPCQHLASPIVTSYSIYYCHGRRPLTRVPHPLRPVPGTIQHRHGTVGTNTTITVVKSVHGLSPFPPCDRPARSDYCHLLNRLSHGRSHAHRSDPTLGLHSGSTTFTHSPRLARHLNVKLFAPPTIAPDSQSCHTRPLLFVHSSLAMSQHNFHSFWLAALSFGSRATSFTPP